MKTTRWKLFKAWLTKFLEIPERRLFWEYNDEIYFTEYDYLKAIKEDDVNE